MAFANISYKHLANALVTIFLVVGTILSVQGICQPEFSLTSFSFTEVYNKGKHLMLQSLMINHLNAELKPICYLLALLGAHHFLHLSRIRVNTSADCSGRKQVNG